MGAFRIPRYLGDISFANENSTFYYYYDLNAQHYLYDLYLGSHRTQSWGVPENILFSCSFSLDWHGVDNSGRCGKCCSFGFW